MLEKLLKLLKPKEKPMHRCVWKAVYLNYVSQAKTKIQREALDEAYLKFIDKCPACSGYEHKDCYYTRRE